MIKNRVIRSFCYRAFFVSLLLGGALVACVEDGELRPVLTTNTPPPIGSTDELPVAFDPTGQTLLFQGSFMNRGHMVKGTAGIYGKGARQTLVFTDFTTEGGPDLRIYLAEDAVLTNALEVSKLTKTGNFFVELPTIYNPNQHRTVLIWCKPFSVLFGYATLSKVH